MGVKRGHRCQWTAGRRQESPCFRSVMSYACFPVQAACRLENGAPLCLGEGLGSAVRSCHLPLAQDQRHHRLLPDPHVWHNCRWMARPCTTLDPCAPLPTVRNRWPASVRNLRAHFMFIGVFTRCFHCPRVVVRTCCVIGAWQCGRWSSVHAAYNFANVVHADGVPHHSGERTDMSCMTG